MQSSSHLAITLAVGAMLTFGAPAMAQGMSGHDMSGHAMAQQATYKFELADPPKALGTKQHVVSIRILQPMQGMADMPVSGVSIKKALLDMGPDNMPTMVAPVTQVPNSTAGVYTFVFDNSVWAEKGRWTLTVIADIKGASKPVIGKVVFQTGN